MANSTRSESFSPVAMFFSYILGIVWSRMVSSWTSAQVPRALTLVSTRLSAPTLSVTPAESSFISPKDLYKFSSCSETVLNELFKRVVSVEVSFSSTVARISSSFFSLLSCILPIAASTTLTSRSFSCTVRSRISFKDFVTVSLSVMRCSKFALVISASFPCMTSNCLESSMRLRANSSDVFFCCSATRVVSCAIWGVKSSVFLRPAKIAPIIAVTAATPAKAKIKISNVVIKAPLKKICFYCSSSRVPKSGL